MRFFDGLHTRTTTVLAHPTIVAGQSDYDTAALSGAPKTAGGTVTYEYFSGGTCSGTPVKVNTVRVTNGVVPKSASHIFSIARTYSWKAVYSGGLGNNKATSKCEPMTVLKAGTALTHTAISCTKPSFAVGKRITCTAIVTGGYTPHTGTITWSKVLGMGGVTFSSKTCTLVAGRCSVTLTATARGGIVVMATYSGDIHNPWSAGTKVLTIA